MLLMPVVSGVIRRRMLVNYRVDPDCVRQILPAQFRPKMAHGYAMAGICLIRLEQIRPKSMPAFVGISSENAAHRIAIEWDEDGTLQEGVFIPRRDTDSVLNHWAGGRLFSGEYNLSKFDVTDNEEGINFKMQSPDDFSISFKAHAADALPKTSVFSSVDESSRFFETGSMGISARHNSNQLDSIRLDTKTWEVQALDVSDIQSSYFDNTTIFPTGSAIFDSALLMRNIAHEWHAIAAETN